MPELRISVRCPFCPNLARLPKSAVGKKVKCNKCNQEFVVKYFEVEPVQVRCPFCPTAGLAPADAINKEVKCFSCTKVFVLDHWQPSDSPHHDVAVLDFDLVTPLPPPESDSKPREKNVHREGPVAHPKANYGNVGAKRVRQAVIGALLVVGLVAFCGLVAWVISSSLSKSLSREKAKSLIEEKASPDVIDVTVTGIAGGEVLGAKITRVDYDFNWSPQYIERTEKETNAALAVCSELLTLMEENAKTERVSQYELRRLRTDEGKLKRKLQTLRIQNKGWARFVLYDDGWRCEITREIE